MGKNVSRTSVLMLSLFAPISFMVPEAHPSSQWIEYKSGNDTVRAYLSIPGGKGPFPALVVIR